MFPYAILLTIHWPDSKATRTSMVSLLFPGLINSSYSYGGNPFTDEDTFWQWFTGAQQAQSNGESQQYQKHNARHYYYREQKPENYSKSEYISMVVLKGLQTFLAFSFFRFSIFFPLGPVLCVILFVNGVRGVITGLRGLFKKKA